MTQEQREAIANAWKILHLAFPDMHGSIRLNLTPDRDYANANLEQGVALEFDGGVIKNLSKRNPNK